MDRVGAGVLLISLIGDAFAPLATNNVSRSLARGGAAETVMALFADALEDTLSSIHDAGRRHALYVYKLVYIPIGRGGYEAAPPANLTCLYFAFM